MPIAVAIWPTISNCASDWTAPLVPSPNGLPEEHEALGVPEGAVEGVGAACARRASGLAEKIVREVDLALDVGLERS